MANQNRAIEFGLLFSLPSALALWLLAEPMIRVLFEHGRFGPDDTLRTAGALAAFAVGLPAFVLVKALTPGFFAREDTRTPLYIALVAIVANIALNVAFLYGTDARPGRHRARLVAVGLAQCRPAGGRPAAARRSGCPTSGWSRASVRMVRRDGRHGRRSVAGPASCWRRRWRTPTCRASSPCSASAPGAPLVYAALGALLGVVKLSELRFVLRRQPGLRPARPNRTTVTPGRSGRFDEGITSTQLS